MPELEFELLQVYLQPGELHLAHKPTIIRTTLGSCVGIAFWSARLGIGALCHSLLPTCPKTSSAELGLATCSRYVDSSIRELARRFDELGALRAEIQVKLFGGADVLPVGNAVSAKPTVGRLNYETAIKVLCAENFHVTASSLGGTSGLGIRFDTRTGEVLLRRLNRAVSEEIGDEG